MSIQDTLNERQKTHGVFANHARICQDLKCVMYTQLSWGLLADDQKEALEMVVHKIARILNGNPNHHDHWLDICGYSQLVADRLKPELSQPAQPTICSCNACKAIRKEV